jgi:protein involved in sex pheromone biosynthesis
MYVTDKKRDIELDKLQDELEAQYGPAVAQDVVDRIRKSEQEEKVPDYMDVKAMSELQERFRAQAMMAVWRLRKWRRVEEARATVENLVVLEGAFLQRQCEDAIKLYREANKSYFSMYRQAMAAFTAKTSTAGSASTSVGRFA